MRVVVDGKERSVSAHLVSLFEILPMEAYYRQVKGALGWYVCDGYINIVDGKAIISPLGEKIKKEYQVVSDRYRMFRKNAWRDLIKALPQMTFSREAGTGWDKDTEFLIFRGPVKLSTGGVASKVELSHVLGGHREGMFRLTFTDLKDCGLPLGSATFCTVSMPLKRRIMRARKEVFVAEELRRNG